MRIPFSLAHVCLVAGGAGLTLAACTSEVAPPSEPSVAGVGASVPSAEPSAPGIDQAVGARRVGSDAAPPEGGVAALDVPAMLAHSAKEIETLCVLTRGCCRAAGQPTFDMAKCADAYRGHGMQGDLADVEESVLRGGKVAFDAARSATCHARIARLGCAAIDAASYSTTASTCSTTFQGTLRPVGICRSSLECQPGFFCEPTDPRALPPTQSGTAPYAGRCMPVKAVAAPCERDDECSYRGQGRACDPGSHRCRALLAKGEACRTGGQCESGLCVGTCSERIDELVTFDECASFL